MKEKKKRGIFYLITKTISWLLTLIVATIGFLLILYIIINKVAILKGNNPPLGLYTIISPSMTPNIKVYDVVFVVEEDPSDIEIGDIISYYSTKSYLGGTPVTHRVVEKFSTPDGYTFRTRGDANPVVDDEVIKEENVIGVTKMVIPQLGRVQFFLASKFGWFVVILIPATGVIIYDIMKLCKLIRIKRKMDWLAEETEEKPKTRTRKSNVHTK